MSASIQDFRVRKGLIVSENTSVSGNVSISQRLSVTNAVSFANTLAVTGTSTLTGNTTLGGFANIGGTLQVTGASTFGAANVTFDTSVLSIDATNNRVGVNTALGQTVAFVVTGAANVIGDFVATNITAASNLTANSLTINTGNSIFDSGVLFVDAANNRVGINNTTPDASLTVTGTANVSGAVRIAGTLNTVLGTSLANTIAVTGNATFSNTIAVTGNATFSNTVAVTGSVSLANVMSVTGLITSRGGISCNNASITVSNGAFIGALNGVANQCGRSILNGTYMLGGAVLTNDVTLSVDATPDNTASKVVARDSSGNFSANTITAGLDGQATAANTLLYDGGNRSATEANTALTIMARDTNGDTFANIFRGTATSSLYADLAEKYLADNEYAPGTVISVGGQAEVTAATETTQHSIIGVVSTAPAHLMNDGLVGGTAIAMKGRVPVKVVGTVQKGDRLTISEQPGIATSHLCRAWTFAIALESSVDPDVKMVEAVIL